MPHASGRVIAVVLALSLLPRSVRASKVSDGVTAGISESTISNLLSLSLDLADPFTLEASWQYLDGDAGRFNIFSAGGDLKLTKSFDIDTVFSFAPRANGVRTLGVNITPTFELDEGYDFYTAFSLPLIFDRYNIISADHQSALIQKIKERCQSHPRRAICQTPITGMSGAEAIANVDQLGIGLAIEQGIYDGTIVAEASTNHYSDKAALTAFGREFSLANTPGLFSRIGSVLPTFPILYEGRIQAAYKLRFGEDSFFTLKPVASFAHLVYEANHGHGELVIAKLVGTFARTIEITAGYQALIDEESDPTAVSPVTNEVITHYLVISLAWLFGNKDDLPPLPEPAS